MPLPANGRVPSAATKPQPASSRCASARSRSRPRERARRRARRGVVVRDDQLVVAREVDVHLERIDAELDRALERRHRVLGALGGGSAMRVQPARVHHVSSSSSSACAGIGGGRGSRDLDDLDRVLDVLLGERMDQPDVDVVAGDLLDLQDRRSCRLDALGDELLADRRASTSLGNSVRFIFLSGCIAGLPNASLALITPSRLAPFSRPCEHASRPGSIVPAPWMYSTVLFSSCGPTDDGRGRP